MGDSNGKADHVFPASVPDSSLRGPIDEVDRELVDLLELYEPSTARQLLVAGTKTFSARGFHASTTREICGEAGLSSAGLYVYFESKEQLLFEISRIGHLGALGAVRSELAGLPAEPASQLQGFVRSFVSFHANHHMLARVCQYELPHLAGSHFAEIAAIRSEIAVVLTDVLKLGVRNGDFRVPSLPTTTISLLSLGIDVARWFRSDGRIGADQLARDYSALALSMVSGRTAGASSDPPIDQRDDQ